MYVHYKSGPITQLVLLRAALIDAFFITVLGAFFLKFDYFKNRQRYVIIIGVVAAILLERYALDTGRWMYNATMPIIPLINTGLTPTIQLGLLSYLVLKIVQRNE